MFKRIFALIVTIAIVASVLTGIGGVVVAESGNPFSSFDARRQAALEGKIKPGATLPRPQPLEGEDYIVTFDCTKKQAADALDGLSYRPLAFSDRLVFLVNLTSPDAFYAKHKSIIAHFEKDISRTSKAFEKNEYAGASRWEFDCLNAQSLPYDAIGDISKVTVALLDSGINRSHPALSGAIILDGFDITNYYAAVTEDLSGHGTRVAGIIAAQTGMTAAPGLAQSASILPIRISVGKDIMTSDLIDGIYMAVDSGADIINMSFGGYERISAEEEAISYAAEHGCLLIAAAGNEGNIRDLAGHYSYPASYDNVISVASVGQNNVICAFSQYNSMVDIAAPGEYLALIGSDNNVVYDNGTSYSAAYVTAAAALAQAYAGRRIGSAAFEKLLEYSCGSSQKDDYSGYGVLNIAALIENCRLPIVFGVSDGVTFFDRVSISYEGAAASLDGEPFENGSTVYTHGLHLLEVTNYYGTRKVSFMLDTIELQYDFADYGSHCVFTFSRGDADIDGVPYASGTEFSYAGSHVFTLRGPSGNTRVKEFSLPAGLPVCHGVSDGGVYNGIVRISVSDAGKAYLNGTPFEKEIFVTKSGSYTLRLTDDIGAASREIKFTLNSLVSFSPKEYTMNAELYTDEKNRVAAFAAKGGKSVLVMPLDDLNSDGRLLFLPDTVLDITSLDDMLCVVYSGGFLLYNIRTLFSVLPITVENYAYGSPFVDAVTVGEDVMFIDASNTLYSLSLRTKQTKRILSTDIRMSKILKSDTQLCLYSEDEGGYMLVLNGQTHRIEQRISGIPCGLPLSVSGSYILCENGVFDAGERACILSYPKTAFAAAVDGLIVTSKQIFTIDGSRVGSFHKNVSATSSEGSTRYTLYEDGSLCFTDSTAFPKGSPLALCAAVNTSEPSDKPYDFSIFETVVSTIGSRVLDIAVHDGSLYVIYDGVNALFTYDGATLEPTGVQYLRHYPVKLSASASDIAVCFDNNNVVWQKSRGYLTAPDVVNDIACADGALFAMCSGRLYVVRAGTDAFMSILGGVNAESIETNGSVLFAATAFDISSFDVKTLALISSTDYVMGGELASDGPYLLAGGYVLRADDLSFVTACGSAAYAVTGTAVISSRGLFDIAEEKFISRKYSGLSFATKGSDDTVYIVYDGTIRRIRYVGNPAALPELNVTDGATINHGTPVYSDGGVMYLNGAPVESGFVPTTNVNYTLRLVFPWELSYTISFSVKYEPQSISLRLSRRHLAPGETARVIASLLPQGADGSITYRVEGSCVTLAEGVVTAVSVGTARIIATVDGTDISAYCDVTVNSDTISCTEPSYLYDADADTLCGVMPGTTVNGLISRFECSSGYFYVVTPEGMIRKQGLVTTGCKLVYRSGDTDIKRIDVSVVGDLDCDGIVTVNDAHILYKTLRSENKFDAIVFKAADINRNGILTGADLNLLNTLISPVPHSEIRSGLSPQLVVPTVLGSDSTFVLTVTVGDLVGTSMMATLSYDSEVLEYLSSSYYEGSVSAVSTPGRLFFTALDIDAKNENRIINVYFKVKKSSPSQTVLTLSDCEVYSDGLFATDGCSASVALSPPSDTFSIKSSNSNLSFSPSTTYYKIAVPEGELKLSLDISLPSGAQLYLPSLNLHSDVTTLSATYVSPYGGRTAYTFVVTKAEKVPVASSSALLAELSILGYEAQQEFSPDLFLYNYTVEASCDAVRLDYNPQNEGVTISVDSPQTLEYGDNIITVVCSAANGDTATYTLIVHRSHPVTEPSQPDESSTEEPVSEESRLPQSHEPSQPSHEPPQPSDNQAMGIALIVIGALCVVMVTTAVVLRLTVLKRK